MCILDSYLRDFFAAEDFPDGMKLFKSLPESILLQLSALDARDFEREFWMVSDRFYLDFLNAFKQWEKNNV